MSAIVWIVLAAIVPTYLLLKIRSGGSLDSNGTIQGLIVGIICLIVAGDGLITGRISASRYLNFVTYRSSDPGMFWSLVMAIGGCGLFYLCRTIARAIQKARSIR